MPLDVGESIISETERNCCQPSFLSIEKQRLVTQMIASSTASVVSLILLNPLSVIKVYLQKPEYKDGRKYGILSVSRIIYKEKGFPGFYYGVRMGFAMSVPNVVLFMSSYEYCRDELSTLVQKHISPNNNTVLNERLSFVVPGVAGAIARMFSVSVIAPLELIRTIQTSGSESALPAILKRIISTNGLGGLYKGWIPTVLRDCPFSAIYWLSFENFKPRFEKLMKSNKSAESNSNMSTFLAGASGSFIAAFCTHPFDVLKTRSQLALMNATTETTTLYRSRLDQVASMYRGLSMRLMTVIPASALIVTIYERVKRINFFVNKCD